MDHSTLVELLATARPWSLQDMAVTLGEVGAAPTDLAHGGVLWRGQRGRFWFEIPEVARYLVVDGEQLTVEPLAGAEPRDVTRFVSSTPSVAAFLQRGSPVLHAAVALGPTGAVLLTGDSSAGKSVLLASLLARGWQLLSDDLAALSMGADGVVRVLPVSDELRLWPDAEAHVEYRPGRFVTEAVTVSRVWMLGASNEPGVTVADITGLDRFTALVKAAYNSRIAAALLDRRANLQIIGPLAHSDIPIRRLTRSRAGWTAEQLADIVAGDTAAAQAGLVSA
ncbi:hypothetical protein [uncultured Jatrophihabitans sp.]|uniref:hypothetical protein n=1 Tax=uncultured Jatrophihabitans sp. TaxID=1610747 RepID=UPI0035CB8191